MADLQKLLHEQASVMGVGAVSVVEDPNDQAASTDGKAIYFNSSFMSKIEGSAGEGGVRFVLAHELGHIADGMGGGHGAELNADQFGARSVAAMGFDARAVSGVMTHLNAEATESHPGSGTREAVALSAFSGKRVEVEADPETVPAHLRTLGMKA